MYMETQPVKLSETEMLMQKIEEFKAKYGDALEKAVEEDKAPVAPQTVDTTVTTTTPKVYQDKGEVIAELERRNIKYDARSSKDNLEKLLA